MKKDVMTPRERVLAVVKGQPVDQIPVMYWLNPHTGCRLMTEYRRAPHRKMHLIGSYLWKRFRRRGGPNAGEWTRALPNLLIGYANGHYLLELGSDMALASIGSMKRLNSMIRMIRRENGHLLIRDPLGCVRGVGGIYLDVVKPPIQSIDDLDGFRLPDLPDDTDVRRLRKDHPEACVLAEVSGVQQVLSDILWDIPQFMLALYDFPEKIKVFQHRLADWAIAQAQTAVRAGADVVFIGDDYGETGRPRISMEMWKEFSYPPLSRLIQAIHEMGAVAMLHSCGYQMPFLQHYVEAGLDILQSFQPKAGNDFEKAYAEYGDRLVFATGIDTQRGESMNPQELRDEIVRNYLIGKRKGRHILAMTHMMQYTMPADNIAAIFDTVEAIRSGV